MSKGISSSGRSLDSHSRGTGIDTRILQLVFLYNYFRYQLEHKFFVPNRKGWRIENMSKGISSSGRALDSHSRGTGIDTRILQLVFLYNYFRYQLQHKFFVPNRKGWRIEQICKGDCSSGRALDSHSIGTGMETRILQLVFLYNYFRCQLQHKFLCAKQKRLENLKNVQGGLAQLVERSIRIREAPRSRHRYSNWLYFTIIFVANCNTSFLCQTEKVGEQNKYARGISSSGRALDSHSIGTGMETRILQLVILYNNFHCQFQRKFFVPNRKGWKNRKYVQGGLAQVVERSSRIREAPRSRTRILQFGYCLQLFSLPISTQFAFERHRDRYPDSPISFSLQLFSLPIATQVFCAKQKSLENRTNMQGGLAQVVERSIRIRQAPGWIPGYSNWLFFTIIFIANFNASFLCQTEKVGEQKKCPRGILSSGRALDSHSRGTGIDTRILQLVFLYNYFRCQLQHKFFVPN